MWKIVGASKALVLYVYIDYGYVLWKNVKSFWMVICKFNGSNIMVILSVTGAYVVTRIM